MVVDVVTEDSRWADVAIDALALRASNAALARLGLDPDVIEVALLACDDARIATLNAEFRGKPAPTNVLSWPAENLSPGDPPSDPEIGDIAIAFDTCAAEAEAAGKPLADHVTHLIVHGTLHLLGYDHIDDDDAALMEGLETEILGNLGLADPYGI
jgi:probable rRNA maturation factor